MEIEPQVLGEGAARFGLNGAELQFLGGMDGAVYQTRQADKTFVLKLEPVLPDKLEAVREKFEFMAYLGDHGLQLASPIPSSQGNLVEIISNKKGLFAATKALKAPGRHVGADNPEVWKPPFFRAWGRTMGRMHHLARRYPYWRRPPADRSGLDLDTAIQDWQMEHASFAQSCPDEAVRQRWVELGEILKTLPVEREGFGLIHNDLHPWNFLYDQGALTVIDFDVCCYHWFITDIAIAVYHACWGEKAQRPANCPAFARSFVEDFITGYLWEYDLDSFWLKKLPLFIRYREMLLFSAFSNTWPEPRKDWQVLMLAQLRQQSLENTHSLAMLFE